MIASIIIFQLILGPWQRTHLSLTSSMTERQFLPTMHFIFPVLILVPQRSEIFKASLSTVLHHKPLLWLLLILVLRTLLHKKDLGRERGITGMVEVTAKEVCLI